MRNGREKEACLQRITLLVIVTYERGFLTLKKYFSKTFCILLEYALIFILHYPLECRRYLLLITMNESKSEKELFSITKELRENHNRSQSCQTVIN